MKYEAYLFDWGDTLMTDFPDTPGKMCDWDYVEAVEGADAVLKSLSIKAKVYVATNASDSSPEEIEKAFQRVGLSQYIDGYFCMGNTGFKKPDPRFYQSILSRINLPPEKVTMTGDSLENDIYPSVSCGINAIWLNPSGQKVTLPDGIREIWRLCEIIS
ncbi:HAD family hydrolase [Desulfococcaceae bacterium HSG9]|nr:HAD family hydrolase [Desulfococcaceae bacterium HSG9]